MSSNDYHFITHWRVSGTVDEVAAILGDPLDLPRWWPAVYLRVDELDPGLPSGEDRRVDLFTKGWLPYTLRWQFRVLHVAPDGFSLVAEGDFVGRGIWTFVQAGADVEVTYDWKLRADKPLLRRLSVLLKPIFAANHRWAMATGEQSLRLELERRHAATDAARALIPAPPGPTTVRAAPIAIGALATGVVIGMAAWRRAARSGPSAPGR